jgi:hypothetical protein
MCHSMSRVFPSWFGLWLMMQTYSDTGRGVQAVAAPPESLLLLDTGIGHAPTGSCQPLPTVTGLG